MAVLNPYLAFSGGARQAMQAYRAIFGGELSLMTFGDAGGGPEGTPADHVMHSQLETDLGFTLMATDLPEQMGPPENGSVSISGSETDELTGYFEALSDGGTTVTPLQKQTWGDTFGSVTDRFGINWMVNIAGSGG